MWIQIQQPIGKYVGSYVTACVGRQVWKRNGLRGRENSRVAMSVDA